MAKSPINLNVLESMAEAGATAGAIVSRVREMLETRRAKDRVRQQRSRRVRKQVSESTVTPCHAGVSHPVTPPPLTYLREESKKETTTTARASPVASEIAKRIAATCGYAALAEDAEHVAAWLADGFTEAFVLAVVRKVMGRRRPPHVVRIGYFDGPLVDERERQRQCALPLPIMTITENPDARRKPAATGWQARRDQQHDALRELSEFVRIRRSGSGGS